MEYTQMLYDVSQVINDKSTVREQLLIIQRIGSGDTRAALRLFPQKLKDGEQRRKFLRVVDSIYGRARRQAEHFYRTSLVEATIYKELDSIVRADPIVFQEDVPIPRVKPTVRRNVWIGLVCGVLVVFALFTVVYYIRQKRKWGEVYTLEDLLRDLWSMFKSALSMFVDELMRALVKTLATAIAIIIVCMIVIYLLPPVKSKDLSSPLRWLYVKLQAKLTGSKMEEVM